MDQVLITTEVKDVAAYRLWAEESGLGLELQAFSDPQLLAGDWQAILRDHQRLLAGFRGCLGLHGAFYDLISASLDPGVVRLTRERYRQNLHAAQELGAGYVVFHANYMGILKLPDYRPGWHRRQVDFWSRFAEEAAAAGLYLLLENMWEDDPTIITDVLAEVNSPHLRACLDIAHAVLYSRTPVAEWIETFEPYLHCCHLNNHDGHLDLHWPLDQGVIDYPPVLRHLRRLPRPPLLTLEMADQNSLKAGLRYLQISSTSA
jgi:sugar phosphate isomerase/epimerase